MHSEALDDIGFRTVNYAPGSETLIVFYATDEFKVPSRNLINGEVVRNAASAFTSQVISTTSSSPRVGMAPLLGAHKIILPCFPERSSSI